MENDLLYRGSVKTLVSDTWWDEIDSIPAVDAVEVVRCRKCVNWEIDRQPNGFFDPDNPRYYCFVNDLFPTGDWFCKDGYPREDDNE